MKKLIILPFLILILFLKVITLSAQTPEATYLSGGGLQKAEILKLQIKDDLKLSTAKFDSVAIIQKDYQNKMRKIKFDKKLTEPIKQKNLKDLAETKTKRLKTAGLDDEEVRKVEKYFQRRVFP